MVLHLKLEQSMACKGGRKKLLLFLLCAVTTQYVKIPFSLFLQLLISSIIQRDVGFLKEKKRMNGVCVVLGLSPFFLSMSVLFSYFLLFFYSGYDTSKTASCEFFFDSFILLVDSD
jgi:hypothetical protein